MQKIVFLLSSSSSSRRGKGDGGARGIRPFGARRLAGGGRREGGERGKAYPVTYGGGGGAERAGGGEVPGGDRRDVDRAMGRRSGA